MLVELHEREMRLKHAAGAQGKEEAVLANCTRGPLGQLDALSERIECS